MASRGGQPNNKNAMSKKPWQAAICRALEKRTLSSKREALDDLAEKFLLACDSGDISAFKDLADRLDGKPTQTIGGDPENPIGHSHAVSESTRELLESMLNRSGRTSS